MNAWAYDHTGNRMTEQPIAIGWIVEWKRRGARGSYRAQITDMKPGKVKIKLLKYSDNPRADLSDTHERWVKPEFLHIESETK